MLAQTQIYSASDGDNYALIAITNEEPTAENIHELFELVTYVANLDQQVAVILDLRKAKPVLYLPFFPDLLKLIDRTRGDQITRGEVWLPGSYAYLMVAVQPLIDQFLHTRKMVIKTI